MTAVEDNEEKFLALVRGVSSDNPEAIENFLILYKSKVRDYIQSKIEGDPRDFLLPIFDQIFFYLQDFEGTRGQLAVHICDLVDNHLEESGRISSEFSYLDSLEDRILALRVFFQLPSDEAAAALDLSLEELQGNELSAKIKLTRHLETNEVSTTVELSEVIDVESSAEENQNIPLFWTDKKSESSTGPALLTHSGLLLQKEKSLASAAPTKDSNQKRKFLFLVGLLAIALCSVGFYLVTRNGENSERVAEQVSFVQGPSRSVTPSLGSGRDSTAGMASTTHKDTTSSLTTLGSTSSSAKNSVETTIATSASSTTLLRSLTSPSTRRVQTTVPVTKRPIVLLAPPASCEVQTGNKAYSGVEVFSPNGIFERNYIFYGANSRKIIETAPLQGKRLIGPQTDNPLEQEWSGKQGEPRNDFQSSDVYFVAAENAQGETSSKVRCSRVEL